MKKEVTPQSMEQRLNGHRITAVIPTLNEANNLKYVLPFIPSIVDEVLIVDGHSDDDTMKVASSTWVKAELGWKPDFQNLTLSSKAPGGGCSLNQMDISAGTVNINLDGSNTKSNILI